MSSNARDEVIGLIRYLISNCLSYGVVVGAGILKVPQILAVARSRSAEGISVSSIYVELLSYVISTSWGVVRALQFRDYGENVFIFVQLVVLLVMVASLQGQLPAALGVLAVDSALFAVLSVGYLPVTLHESLMSMLILFSISSRVPQILLNYRRKSTGQLSFATFFLALGGGVARVLTTAVNVPREKGKFVMLGQFSVAALLNVIVIAQILWYGRHNKSKPSAGAAAGSKKATKKKN